ncbi:hypothetical protein BN8_02900 [Fibrisoma limi BUZ 3]|uniref:Uncharacterized protein n=1 Tax=Fibrisoma limi BUZ 3 TaxID=1185876 RepID=I2GIQ3_9BACT|nr:hypothetical protein BN8_02900 [Fibrisoma limi BUZ 3]
MIAQRLIEQGMRVPNILFCLSKTTNRPVGSATRFMLEIRTQKSSTL